jgi:hypothetical protein
VFEVGKEAAAKRNTTIVSAGPTAEVQIVECGRAAGNVNLSRTACTICIKVEVADKIYFAAQSVCLAGIIMGKEKRGAVRNRILGD